jgi:hypothetical protein
MKHYSNAVEESTTDVNGAWKPLKPLQEGFEFIGDDQYDNFLTKKGKERRDLRQQGRASGLTRKEARKEAKSKVPLSPRQRELAHKVLRTTLVVPRGAFISLLRLNYRGFAWKIDSILNSNDVNLKTKLTEKWYGLGGELDKLIEATNAGKNKKPFFCGKACKQQLLDKKSNFSDDSDYYNITGAEIVAVLIANAKVVITALGGILSAVVGSTINAVSKNKEIKSAERIANQENETLSKAEKDRIALEMKKIEAETDPRNQIVNNPNLTEEEKESALKLLDESEGKKLGKDVVKYVIIGGIALVAIFLISKTIKKK